MPSIPDGAFTLHVGGFKVTRRGRFWVVKDPQGVLVCVTVYKKGALEVVRRLLPPDLRHLTERSSEQSMPCRPMVRQAARRYDPHQK